MATVTGSVTFNPSFAQAISSGVVSAQTISAGILQQLNYQTSGTGAGQVDLIYAKQLSLAGAATTLDLTSLTDLVGAAVNMLRVREIIVQSLATTAAYTVTIGNAASNSFAAFLGATGTYVLQPSVGVTSNYNLVRFSDPYSVGAATGAVTSGTSKDLKLDPGANTISVNVLILGCSAVS